MSEISRTLRRSVTEQDVNEVGGGNVIQFMLPIGLYSQSEILPPAPPDYWSQSRDKVLLSTLYAESLWSSAVSIACTKMAAAAWEIEGHVPLRVKNSQDLFITADLQRGWVHFIQKHVQAYLLTDNGAFIEIVRASSSLNSKIIGLVHLDPTRCMRTGDPEIPVIYQDRVGRLHELRRHEVIDIADMPDTRESFYGVGHCAAARAYQQIAKLSSVEQYIYEKITGRTIKEAHFVAGINEKQVSNFVSAAQHQADAKGLIAYMGAVIVPIPGDRAPSVASIPLAEFPDGFNRKEEFDIAVLAYADAIGLDPQDIQPLTGRYAGTAQQSMVLDDKAAGKGLASWRATFTHAMNYWVLPGMTTMAFIEKDWREKNSQADFSAKTSKYIGESVAAGILTAQQGLQALVDENIYPKEFLPVDQTPDTNLSDTEKPEDELVDQPEAAAPTADALTGETPILQLEEKSVIEDTVIAEEEEAAKLVNKIRKTIQRRKKLRVAKKEAINENNS